MEALNVNKLCSGFLLILTVTAGCRSFRTMSPEFAAHPAAYRRIAVAPICLHASGQLDKTLGPMEVETQGHAIASNLGIALQETLRAKGYDTAGPVTVVSCEQDYAAMDSEIRKELEEVRREIQGPLFDYAFPELRAGATNSLGSQRLTRTLTVGTFGGGFWNSKEPFHFRMNSRVSDLPSKLGCSDADALLVMDTSVFFESPAHAAKRAAWNWTGGALIFLVEIAAAGAGGGSASSMPDPFLHTCSSVDNTIVLLDPRTQEVLWFDERYVPQTDGRRSEKLKFSINTALTYFPKTTDKNRAYFRANERFQKNATTAKSEPID